MQCKMWSTNNHGLYYLFIITAAVSIDAGESLQLVNMVVPRIADPRDNVTITCQFDMGSDHLYSVKWYKDGQEFFRYTPSQSPPTFNFSVEGIQLGSSVIPCNSRQCPVVLTKLGHESSGTYQCEVSTEGPTFRIVHKSANLTVAALPRRGPIIHGLFDHYAEGDMIQGNCTADKSDPPAHIMWFINDREARPSLISHPTATFADELGLMSRSVLLKMPAERSMFSGPSGKLQLRCVARVPFPENISPPMETTAVATLFPVQAEVRNQKLEWPNSAAGNLHQCFILLLSVTIGNVILISSFRSLYGCN